MSEKKCPECNGNIILKYITPTKTFSIGNNRQLKRCDQNLIMNPAGDNSYLVFSCENDSEHNIETDEIFKWIDEIESIFYGEGYYKF